jgi:acyl-CoA reductase-like NAD-dependent aldehyde dehydrogenase
MSELRTENPFTLREIKKYKMHSFDECHGISNKLVESQQQWRDLDLLKRIRLVKDGLNYFETHRGKIALDLCEQMGRPLHHAQFEINGFFERANYLCDIAQETLSADIFTDKDGFEREIHHKPLGVIFVIAAWNYPLLISVNSIIPALISGNTVLLKHSSLTPEIGSHFEKAFTKLGDHNFLLKQVIVNHETTGQIIENSKIDHVIFTGSVNGGKSILNHTQHRFMLPTMELGGKDGAYVDKDVDLKQAAETIVDGAMFNSGQSCCGIERVYVHEDQYDQFIELAKNLISNYKLGDPQDETTSMGPLAQAKSSQIMTEQVQEAVSQGARLVCGGKVEKIQEAIFFQPTLIVDTDHSMSIMKEENFGPILPVMKVGDIHQAIDFINDSEYGLTSSIFTVNKQHADLFFEEAESGTVFMNRCDYLDPALAWAGVKNSGCGASLSKYGFHNVTRRKSKNFKLKI